MQEIEGIIKRIIANILCLKTEEVTLRASIVEDLGADSLDEMEIATVIKDEFGIEITDNDVEEIETVQNVIDYVKKRLSEIEIMHH